MSNCCTVDSRYYDICYNEMLHITIPNLYLNHSQTIEIQTDGYIDTFSLSHQYRNNVSLLYLHTHIHCRYTNLAGSHHNELSDSTSPPHEQ
jgi:hypothetical protein